ncbi:sigma-70 family RNA polymerase sigma factor [Clostridium sp.]|uniref:sigma-70 family RNA polymerase sigma factor n=1 Tax=Clostridium sp. TaxID=1506 RepID=UPI002618D6A3|nr:sigma-70 family RNA polymerase sigma factor [Clostridium sp.]
MSNEELFVLYKQGNKNALNELIENNKGVIYKIANKYKFDGIEEEDLIQTGIVGLIQGINKYDIKNKNRAKLITYAIYWIDREINNYVNGRSEKDKMNNKLYKESISLNMPVGEEGTELGEFIEGVDYAFENIIEIEFLRELRIQLDSLMSDKLTLEEREIIKFNYGWNSREMTLQEIGEILGLNKGKVSLRKERALTKMRMSSWAIHNSKSFMEMGYIKKMYANSYYKHSSSI